MTPCCLLCAALVLEHAPPTGALAREPDPAAARASVIAKLKVEFPEDALTRLERAGFSSSPRREP